MFVSLNVFVCVCGKARTVLEASGICSFGTVFRAWILGLCEPDGNYSGALVWVLTLNTFVTDIANIVEYV